MTEVATVSDADRDTLWKAVVLDAGAWALDRMSCEDDEATGAEGARSIEARIGGWFVFGLWAHLVWRHDREQRALSCRGGEPARYYGPGGLGAVACGPGGTATEAEAIRAKAWADAVDLGFAELIVDAKKSW
jgi:hypothetical protein